MKPSSTEKPLVIWVNNSFGNLGTVVQKMLNITLKRKPSQSLYLTAIPMRSIAAGEFYRLWQN